MHTEKLKSGFENLLKTYVCVYILYWRLQQQPRRMV